MSTANCNTENGAAMKILVTGATGLVGSALVAALARDGHMVCRLVRPQTKTEGGAAGTFDVAWNPETGELGGAAGGAEEFRTRVVIARFGIILAKNGGALPKMMLPFEFGAGGRVGSGKQWMSWVALEDVIEIIRFALNNRELRGAVNVVAPEPVTNAEFAKQLARAMHRPALFPAPSFALRFAMGEMADALLLASQRVMPELLTSVGYRFLDSSLGPALKKLSESQPKK